MLEKQRDGSWDAFAEANKLEIPNPTAFEHKAAYEKAQANLFKAISQTSEYIALVKEKMQKAQHTSGEVGNMYACSIFMALMGTLEADLQEDAPIEGKQFGFFSYGSGSKSKVFEATVQPQWKEVVAGFNVAKKLANRQALEYDTYEMLHRKRLKTSVLSPSGEFALASVGTEGVTLGARYYNWIEAAVNVL